MITSTQVDSSRILLAYHAEGCPSLCQSLRQMPKVQQHHQIANGRAQPDDDPMAFYSIGIGNHGPIPNSDETTEVPSGRHRLLYQIGGS